MGKSTTFSSGVRTEKVHTCCLFKWVDPATRDRTKPVTGEITSPHSGVSVNLEESLLLHFCFLVLELLISGLIPIMSFRHLWHGALSCWKMGTLLRMDMSSNDTQAGCSVETMPSWYYTAQRKCQENTPTVLHHHQQQPEALIQIRTELRLYAFYLFIASLPFS